MGQKQFRKSWLYSPILRTVWRYQRGNQNPYIEGQTTQWPKEKVQKDKQRSTKHTYKTKDRVRGTPLKTGGEIRCSGMVSSSCSTSDTRRVNLVKCSRVVGFFHINYVNNNDFKLYCNIIISYFNRWYISFPMKISLQRILTGCWLEKITCRPTMRQLHFCIHKFRNLIKMDILQSVVI